MIHECYGVPVMARFRSSLSIAEGALETARCAADMAEATIRLSGCMRRRRLRSRHMRSRRKGTFALNECFDGGLYRIALLLARSVGVCKGT